MACCIYTTHCLVLQARQDHTSFCQLPAMLLCLLSLLRVCSRLAASPLLSDTQTASGTITEGKRSRLAAALIWTMGYLTPGNVSTCPVGLKVYRRVAGPAAATDCITPYRRSLLTMSLTAVVVLIVRGVPTEHWPSKTSTATTVAVVMRCVFLFWALIHWIAVLSFHRVVDNIDWRSICFVLRLE